MLEQTKVDPVEKLVEELKEMVGESGIELSRREAEKAGHMYADHGPGATKIYLLGRGTESGKLLAKVVAKVSRASQQDKGISKDACIELVRKLPVILETWDEIKGK